MNTPRFGIRAALIGVAGLFLSTCREDRFPTVPSTADPTPAPSFTTTSATAAVLIGAGDIASCSKIEDEATARLLDSIPGTVFTAGDNAYDKGSSSDYANCYGPTWGRHKDRTRPAPGERDYKTAGAAGYFTYFGPAAGDPTKGYYSYELGEWHIVVLNSNLSMNVGSLQEQWLKADLAASTRQCTLAYWHQPRFWSNGVSNSVKPLWDALFAAGAEIVVNAHQRNYERFAPQSPDGVRNDAHGIREFIVGTGGAGTTNFSKARANSEARSTGTAGVLKLTLDAGSYAWEFVPVAGKTYTDQGSGTCHDAGGPPVADPGGPYSSDERTVQLDGTRSSDPQGDLPLTYAWDFGDGATGSGDRPTHTYTADGSYTVTLTVTDSKGNASVPATTTLTIANVAPAVDAGADRNAQPGETVTLTINFSDPGGDDAPWTYRITWGDGLESNGSTISNSDPIVASHVYMDLGDYPVEVTVTDADGGAGMDALTVRLGAAGTTQVFVGAGDIAACTNDRDELTAQLLDNIAGTVFTIGDNAYPNGTAVDYANCYHPTWGRHRDRTFANLGNHDYDTGTADPSFDYFGDRAGPRGKGYYSFDLGDWHIVVLNDNSSFVPFREGSVQDVWLQNDLAASPKRCTLAVWHRPLFYSSTSTTTIDSNRRIFWQRLYAAGAELVLNGHRHQYERFTPQTPDGVEDLETGIREIIVGTGGEGVVVPVTTAANSEVRSSSFGIIKLALGPDGYTWEFIPMAGETFTDSGSGRCH